MNMHHKPLATLVSTVILVWVAVFVQVPGATGPFFDAAAARLIAQPQR